MVPRASSTHTFWTLPTLGMLFPSCISFSQSRNGHCHRGWASPHMAKGLETRLWKQTRGLMMGEQSSQLRFLLQILLGSRLCPSHFRDFSVPASHAQVSPVVLKHSWKLWMLMAQWPTAKLPSRRGALCEEFASLQHQGFSWEGQGSVWRGSVWIKNSRALSLGNQECAAASETSEGGEGVRVKEEN